MKIEELSNLLPAESEGPEETIEIGTMIAPYLSQGDIVAIFGDLGAGKTHLVKGICTGLGIERDKVSSPTFSLVNEYDGSLKVSHFDFYRIEKVEELFDLGYQEYFFSDGICLIEWPEKFPELMPPTCINLELEHQSLRKRTIRLRRQ